MAVFKKIKENSKNNFFSVLSVLEIIKNHGVVVSQLKKSSI